MPARAIRVCPTCGVITGRTRKWRCLTAGHDEQVAYVRRDVADPVADALEHHIKFIKGTYGRDNFEDVLAAYRKAVG